MILPTKHLTVEKSLLGIGAVLLDELRREQTVSRLWEKVRKNKNVDNFEQFTRGLVFLYSINAIEKTGNLLRKKRSDT